LDIPSGFTDRKSISGQDKEKPTPSYGDPSKEGRVFVCDWLAWKSIINLKVFAEHERAVNLFWGGSIPTTTEHFPFEPSPEDFLGEPACHRQAHG